MNLQRKSIHVSTCLSIIFLCFQLSAGAQKLLEDGIQNFRLVAENVDPSLDNNRVEVDANPCPKKCVCTSSEKIECSSMSPQDFHTGMFGKDAKKITKLDLRKNSLESLPHDLFEDLTGLKELVLSDNRFSEIPSDFLKKFSSLTKIDLSRNKISNISENSFRDNIRLQYIDVSHNRIRRIEPEAFHRLPDVQFINLAHNQLEIIHGELFRKCSNLEEIEIKRNPIKTIHYEAFAGLPKLKKLMLSEIENIPELPNLNGSWSLTALKIDRSNLQRVPETLCKFSPNLKSIELRSNKITVLPNFRDCKNLRVLDLSHNLLTDLGDESDEGPFDGLDRLHDLLLSHNGLKAVGKNAFKGLTNLEILDLMANRIDEIHDDAFSELNKLEDLNLGMNTFAKFPSRGLTNIVHIKTHNNPNLKEFPGSSRFPKVKNLVLSYAYHCCQFIPSTFENLIPEFPDFDHLKESIFLPGEHAQWDANESQALWGDSHVNTTSLSSGIWDVYGTEVYTHGSIDELQWKVVTPPPGIQCMPAPGTFLPCNDLFDWWTLRCSIWIVFLLALLGNGCVVIVLVASRGKMDVPRFLVCNLAAADFFMGLYLGFLAVVDASTLGEFRRHAISWQFSTGCQVAGFFGVLSSELSVFTLAVITLERNYAITHAMHLNKRLSLRHAAYIMLAGWTFAILTATMPLIGVSDYRKFAVCLPFETGDPLSLGYVIFLTLINGVGFSILMGCYLKMYCAIRGSQAWNSNDSRIAKRMALLVFTDFICWFPIALFALTSCFGVHLINLEQAKVFTVFVLPLNSCFNPFLYAILTKQFKKDCVMICKAIEESRVTRGIGRCRHSSNFSNRQTPANTNSLNSGSGTHGSQAGNVAKGGKAAMCNCNLRKNDKNLKASLVVRWPFNKLKKFFLGYKDGNEIGEGLVATNSEYAQQIAEIQLKQKTKRQASLSSDNFSSSRSDSWRLHGGHHPQCIQQQIQHGRGRGVANGVGGGTGHDHRRRNSWTVTRKPSQDSQLSSSRNDSHSSSNSTQTWRISRSSVSSEMGNSVGRHGSNASSKAPHVPANAPIDPVTGKLNISAVHNQRINGGIIKARQPTLVRQVSENSGNQGKPKLIRQTAVMADGDSSGSVKSVSFREPHPPAHVPAHVVVGGARRFITAAAEVGTCPLHSHEKYKSLYEKLPESSHEESDMEPSDAESDDGKTTQPRKAEPSHGPLPESAHSSGAIFMHRKLSTISSKDRDSKEEMTSPESNQETVFNATADVIAPFEPVSPTQQRQSSAQPQSADTADGLSNEEIPFVDQASSFERALAMTSPSGDSAEEPVISEDQAQRQSLLESSDTGDTCTKKKYLNTEV